MQNEKKKKKKFWGISMSLVSDELVVTNKKHGYRSLRFRYDKPGCPDDDAKDGVQLHPRCTNPGKELVE